MSRYRLRKSKLNKLLRASLLLQCYNSVDVMVAIATAEDGSDHGVRQKVLLYFSFRKLSVVKQ